jgi:O-antigen ligase
MRAMSLSAASGRMPIWRAAANIVRDHPWLGVGPGNYTVAMLDGGYAEKFLYQVEGRYSGAEQAHNLLIHVAAETGVFGALFLLALFLWLVRGCWRAFRAGEVPLVSAGLLCALLAFLMRSMSDDFLDGLITTDRTRVLVWALFAAALAVCRLPLTVEPRRS